MVFVAFTFLNSFLWRVRNERVFSDGLFPRVEISFKYASVFSDFELGKRESTTTAGEF